MDALATISLRLLCCDGLGLNPNAGQAMAVLQSMQGRFFDFTVGKITLPVTPALESRIDYSGQILGLLSYEHALLAHDYWKRLAVWKGEATESQPGNASFWFLQRGAWSGIAFSQDLFEAEGEDLVAAGLFALGRQCFPRFRPRFASIDFSGFNEISFEAVAGDELPHLYWMNYWGPTYAKKIGAERLRTLPSGSVEIFADGSVLHRVTEKFTNWHWSADCREVLNHLRPVFPNIERYYPRGEDYFPELFDG